MRNIKTAIICIVETMIAYLLCAFVTWETSTSQWDNETRGALIALSVSAWIVTIAIRHGKQIIDEL